MRIKFLRSFFGCCELRTAVMVIAIFDIVSVFFISRTVYAFTHTLAVTYTDCYKFLINSHFDIIWLVVNFLFRYLGSMRL